MGRFDPRYGPLSVGDALKVFLKKTPLKDQMNKVQIQEIWEKEMGKTISKYTKSIQVTDRKLVICTDVAPLKQELSFSKELIKKRINGALGRELIETVIIK